MPEYQLVKLLIDAAMVGSVLYLVFRVSRGGDSSKLNPDYLHGMENSFRRIISEAEEASKDLGKDLAKRQKGLEEVLFDIETVEHRVNKAIEQAQAIKRNVSQEVASPAPAPQHYSNPTTATQPAPSSRPIYEQREAEILSEEVEPPSFGFPSQPAPSPRTQAQPQEQPQAVNIYGEPIEKSSRRSVSNSVPLREQIEKEETEQVQNGGIEEIYAKAEELIRAGHDVAKIALDTNLSEQDVEMLAKIVSVEDEENQPAENNRNVSAADERLGVLSAIQRDRQVL